MELYYSCKKTREEILNIENPFSLSPKWNGQDNLLIEGDNFYAMRLLLSKYKMQGKIDLIYIDPPFATNNTFTIGYKRVSTISASKEGKIAYQDKLVGEEFIEFLRERLFLAYELLSDKGSLYLHMDCKIGHYVKIILDEIFGPENFKNDITRIKCNPKNFSRRSYGNIKDVIFFYTKSKNAIWNEQYEPFSEEEIKRLYKKTDKSGRAYTTIPLHAPGETKNGATCDKFHGIKPPAGRHWRSAPKELEELDKRGLIEWSKNGVPRKIIYADEQKGKKIQDIWYFKDYQYPAYPTEKNLELLKLLIKTSSVKESIVMDFFSGSGTTLEVAQKLGRKWIGIDKSSEAIKIAKQKLSAFQSELFGQVEYELAKLTQ